MKDIVRAKQRAGVTVNDVCLAAVSGALRELALLRREQPQPLKAMVPVSVRADDQRQDMGNQISFAFIELPVEVRSRAGRLERVHEATAAFKTSGRPAGTGAMLGALGLLPDPLKDRAARLASSPRVFNLTVSNIPGPRFPVYMLGAKLSEAYPVVPLAEQHALSIGMFSYMDDLFFGLYADPAVLPEVEEVPAYLEAEIAGLAVLRGGANAARHGWPRSPLARPGCARSADGCGRAVAPRLPMAGEHDLRVQSFDAAQRFQRLRVGDVQRAREPLRAQPAGDRVPRAERVAHEQGTLTLEQDRAVTGSVAGASHHPRVAGNVEHGAVRERLRPSTLGGLAAPRRPRWTISRQNDGRHTYLRMWRGLASPFFGRGFAQRRVVVGVDQHARAGLL